MSTLDQQRWEFLDQRFNSESTKANYTKSFKKFDTFLEAKGLTEDEFFKRINVSQVFERYQILQELINSINKSVSPAVTRNYFDNLFLYFLLKGAELDYTQKKLRLKFPRVISKAFDGLDRPVILKLFSHASFNFKLYMATLAGAGLRETEGLLLKPWMILFDENPPRIKLPGEITKFNIPRETFLPLGTAKMIQQAIAENNTKQDEFIFIKSYNDRTLSDFEKYFARIRTRAGLDTPNREKNQQNDITLHSFRAYFITTFTDLGLESFGRALAGHSKFKNVYFRKSARERAELYVKAMPLLDFNS